MSSKPAEDTPMMKQFFAVKAQHPEALLLYRVGDFYETYSDDAVTASKVLGLVLTKRSNGDKGSMPMAGFPHHALDSYLPKLVGAGIKVAVCDQLEDPKLAGRKLVKRGITELVTPGISFGDATLTQKENNFLMGLFIDKETTCGVAFLDVSTGSFQISQGSSDYSATLAASLNPKEIVLPRGCEKTARSIFGDQRYYSTMDEWAFVYDSAVAKLCKQFNVSSLKGYAVDNFPLGICAAGALMAYLEQTQHFGLKNICSLSRIDESKFVWMDQFTLRNLEIFVSNTDGGKSLVDCIDHCSCAMGSRMLRSWVALPIMDIAELNSRYDVIEHLVQNSETLDELKAHINDLGDMERILSRVAAGKAAPREVLQLGRGLSLIPSIAKTCKSSCKALNELAARLSSCKSLKDIIFTTILKNTAAKLGQGDVIAPGVNPKLDELRSIARGQKEYLREMQIRESKRTGIPSLKISYNNIFGYFIEVRNTFKNNVPSEWIRKQTLVNAERYITEELKEYEQKILGAEEKIYAIESEEYSNLISKIQEKIPEIQSNAKTIARLDVLCGFASLAISGNYCRPQVNTSLSLKIKKGRHPVIESQLPDGEEYVPNDILLDSKRRQIIILTGPNMAGKSALLRQTALIVLMAQIGSFVPAESVQMGYFDKIFTRVGASDNISQGESTFMVEMLETAMILHNLSERSLVLLDEIGRGTATYDGMSIAGAIVEYLHDYGHRAKTLFATHYHELNDMAHAFPRVLNCHIQVKESGKDIIFLRTLADGGSDRSFGIHVARLAGMPKEVLRSAERTLKALEQEQGQATKLNLKESHSKELDEPVQLSLFQLEDPSITSIRLKLENVDLNNITPLQAFDLLREVKKELGV